VTGSACATSIRSTFSFWWLSRPAMAGARSAPFAMARTSTSPDTTRRRNHDAAVCSLPAHPVLSGGHRHSRCLFHHCLLLRLPGGERPGRRYRRQGPDGRALSELHPACRAAVHRCRKHHERRHHFRPAAAVLCCCRRPLPGRARPRQHRRIADLFRHVRFGRRGCGGNRQDHHRHDDPERALQPRLRGGDYRCLGNHRSGHPAIDPDGALRFGLQHVDRVSVSRRYRAGPVHGRGADDDEHADFHSAQLHHRGAGSAQGPAAADRERLSGAADAGDPALRHLWEA
jgi:hypothetical protein